MLFNNEEYKEMVRKYNKEYTQDLKTTANRFYANFSTHVDAVIRGMLENGESKVETDLANLIGLTSVREYADGDHNFISEETNRRFKGWEILNELCYRVGEQCDGIQITYAPNDKGFYNIKIDATSLYSSIAKEEGDNNEKEKEE